MQITLWENYIPVTGKLHLRQGKIIFQTQAYFIPDMGKFIPAMGNLHSRHKLITFHTQANYILDTN